MNNTATRSSSMIEVDKLEHEQRERGEVTGGQAFIGGGTANSPAYLSGGLIDEAGKLAIARAKATGTDFYFTIEGNCNLFRASPDGTISEPDVIPDAVRTDARRMQIFRLLQGKE